MIFLKTIFKKNSFEEYHTYYISDYLPLKSAFSLFYLYYISVPIWMYCVYCNFDWFDSLVLKGVVKTREKFNGGKWQQMIRKANKKKKIIFKEEKVLSVKKKKLTHKLIGQNSYWLSISPIIIGTLPLLIVHIII